MLCALTPTIRSSTIPSLSPAGDPARLFEVRPYTPHCRVIFEDRDHAVIGVSPGNSYFSARRLADLARWGAERFDRVDLVHTDLHVAEMYAALGYGPDDARRKAGKNLRGVRAKVRAAVDSVGGAEAGVRARPLSALADIPAYRALHEHVLALLDTDAQFRGVCDALVSSFLSARVLGGREPTERQRRACLRYVCAEAPLFVDTPAILGVPSSLNCYHQLLPMAELLYSRGSGLRASRNQGHAVVTPAEEDSDDR
ncbi:tRNA-dependent cyclodipeptide synthase [Actinomadura kijaniata]|uniref:tRNA-dependent cyclodipeptide synthase n=1 Tax=Actinomadura kijaniata TaxID=46161 RepID=UPI003F1D7D35